MFRRITLTLVPCVALFAIATSTAPAPSMRAQAKADRHVTVTSSHVVARRSGYIVASS